MCVVLTFMLVFALYFQSFYFDRDDIALKGFSKRFKECSDEERGHAEMFMKYQNKRGGRIVLQPIPVRIVPTMDACADLACGTVVVTLHVRQIYISVACHPWII